MLKVEGLHGLESNRFVGTFVIIKRDCKSISFCHNLGHFVGIMIVLSTDCRKFFCLGFICSEILQLLMLLLLLLQIQDVVFFVAVVVFGIQNSFLIDGMAEQSKRICMQ